MSVKTELYPKWIRYSFRFIALIFAIPMVAAFYELVFAPNFIASTGWRDTTNPIGITLSVVVSAGFVLLSHHIDNQRMGFRDSAAAERFQTRIDEKPFWAFAEFVMCALFFFTWFTLVLPWAISAAISDKVRHEFEFDDFGSGKIQGMILQDHYSVLGHLNGTGDVSRDLVSNGDTILVTGIGSWAGVIYDTVTVYRDGTLTVVYER